VKVLNRLHLHTRRYYALVASLPHLAWVEKLASLPISREQLDLRLQMLHPDDHAQALRMERFLEWEYHKPEFTDADHLAAYQALVAECENDVIAEVLEHRLQVRTVMAALRRRRCGQLPAAGVVWGLGEWQVRIERRWDVADFGLTATFPWLPRAQLCLDQQDPVELQRLLTRVVWTHLDRISQKQDFSFDLVLVYLFKWDIARRWLAHDGQAAVENYRQLLNSALGNHQKIYAGT